VLVSVSPVTVADVSRLAPSYPNVSAPRAVVTPTAVTVTAWLPLAVYVTATETASSDAVKLVLLLPRDARTRTPNVPLRSWARVSPDTLNDWGVSVVGSAVVTSSEP